MIDEYRDPNLHKKIGNSDMTVLDIIIKARNELKYVPTVVDPARTWLKKLDHLKQKK